MLRWPLLDDWPQLQQFRAAVAGLHRLLHQITSLVSSVTIQDKPMWSQAYFTCPTAVTSILVYSLTFTVSVVDVFVSQFGRSDNHQLQAPNQLTKVLSVLTLRPMAAKHECSSSSACIWLWMFQQQIHRQQQQIDSSYCSHSRTEGALSKTLRIQSCCRVVLSSHTIGVMLVCTHCLPHLGQRYRLYA